MRSSISSVSRRGAGLVIALLIALVSTACTSRSADTAAPTPAPPPTIASPVPAGPDPSVGECRNLSFAAATKSVDESAAIPCKGLHTSTTYAVGQLDLVVDGHLMAMDSVQVRNQLDDKCSHRLSGWVGGDTERLRLSRLRPVWFRPGVTEADRGASWFRCDVVAVATDGQLARYTGKLKGVLDADEGLDRFGLCGTASPSAKNFRKVICSSRHAWRAVATVELAPGADYLGRKAAAAADSVCQDKATERTEPSLKFVWAFQWPTREEFAAGQRYGWCWLPD